MAKGVLFGDAPREDEDTGSALPPTERPPLVEFDVGCAGCLVGLVIGVAVSIVVGALVDVASGSNGDFPPGAAITLLGIPLLGGLGMAVGWGKGGTKLCSACGSRVRKYREICSYCGRPFNRGQAR
jgi:hypothetical protein